jgi:hypothetical protein
MPAHRLHERVCTDPVRYSSPVCTLCVCAREIGVER